MSKLKEYRECKELSQKELADITGVNKRMIQNYEQGQRNISGASAERLYRIAIVLGCKIEDLLDNKEEIYMETLERMYNEK